MGGHAAGDGDGDGGGDAMDAGAIRGRLQAVREGLVAAARCAGRSPDEITLIGVSKRQPIEALFAAFDAGLRDFGENVAQELRAKAAAFADRGGEQPRWHMIGRLQRNKINMVLPHVSLLHTIDSAELARAVAQRVSGPVPCDVLLQVNIGREPQKGGVDPEPEALAALADCVRALPALRLRGLMAIPPFEADATPYFDRMRAALEHLQVHLADAEASAVRELSMGMSHDYAQAIAHGATMVRVGTAIFGERSY